MPGYEGTSYGSSIFGRFDGCKLGIEPGLQMTTNMAGHCTQTQVRYMTLPLVVTATTLVSPLIGQSGPLLLSHWPVRLRARLTEIG